MDSKIFSLEIFIDRIRLSAGEKCLFPSTILKLLSYEPALISSIDNKVQENLRDYIDPIEKQGKVKQIEQLKDIDGNYIIRKGKSILFESNTVTLMNELSILPLYILVTDEYYNPSHLVGVVAINLSSVMNRLAQKISKQSITVSDETGGRFPILNLMGETIGALILRLRLIFVGENIGRHIPKEQEIEIRPKITLLSETAEKLIGADAPVVSCDPSPPVPTTIVRNFGCQVDEKRSIRVQVVPQSLFGDVSRDRTARIGLSIDPNDPLLEGPPPLIYNSQYAPDDSHYRDDYSDYLKKDNKTDKETIVPGVPPPDISPKKRNTTELPILNALFTELKAWKSEDFVEDTVKTPPKPIIVNRSKSADVRPPIKSNPSEFLRRMSKPKVRPQAPTGIVPKNLGWIRTEPQFIGPKKSSLEYKLTKTQLRRIELTNPRLFDSLRNGSDPAQEARTTSALARTGDETSATTYTELPPKKRHPLVPPLFNPGTSISVPSFTQTESSSTQVHYRHPRRDNDPEDVRSQRLPPRSPDRQRNNNSQTMSFETNGTVDEADHFLNMNPVQSNRSPQMTKSQANDNGSETAEEDEEDRYYDSADDRRPYAYNNRSDEYSEGSFSNSNGPVSVSKRYSNASQISQTSEWMTGASHFSSVSQNYLNEQESPPQSPDIGTYQSPPRSPVKSRRSLLVSGVIPGGRFSNIGSNRQMRSSEGFAASFDEAAERTNYTTSGSLNVITERDRDDRTKLSYDQMDDHPTRLASPGADVTSFTKVTKFDRSIAPGRQSNNYLGTNYLTSTVASMQTDDSQMLTSESFS